MNAIINNINWDTDGQLLSFGRINQGYVLPAVVLVLDVPDLSEETKDRLTDLLSDWFGFCHYGFDVSDAKEYENLTWAVDAIHRYEE